MRVQAGQGGRAWARRAGLGLVVFALSTVPATAVLLSGGDGTRNTTAPSPDPGFEHAGVLSSNTAVYLGGGWVLSADHVALGPVELGGLEYPRVPGSEIQLEYAPGVLTDLRMFRLLADPVLPDLEIATNSPQLNETLVLVGHGRERGIETSFQGSSGYTWGSARAMRWGENRVTATGLSLGVQGGQVRALGMTFDAGGLAEEAVAVTGDSGGPVFRTSGAMELAGIMFSRWAFVGQPGQTSIHGNGTYVADLAYYRGQIDAIRAERACDNGIDDDGDGQADEADSGCTGLGDAFETDATLPCDDGFDSDGDGLVDLADPGCGNPEWITESPRCDDGLDNDGDGFADWDGGTGGGEPDPECIDKPYRNREGPDSCGLGFELALLVPLLRRLRRA